MPAFENDLPGHVSRDELLGVFKSNRQRPIHRWYPFVEGFSSDLVDLLLRAAEPGAKVFDPFAGSGTTGLSASTNGRQSFYTEANPYMSWLAGVKVNTVRSLRNGLDFIPQLTHFASSLPAARLPPANDTPLVTTDAIRNFFPPGVASTIASTLLYIEDELSGAAADIARVAVATSLVPTSNMLRRTDLRRRRPAEPGPVQFLPLLEQRLALMIDDLRTSSHLVSEPFCNVGDDARGEIKLLDDTIDITITSPPYLNGTNYGRNTKLELLALGFIHNEADLSSLRRRELTAGINNVTKTLGSPKMFDDVEQIASKVDLATYDRRIPTMIRSYFSDMYAVFANVRRISRAEATFWLDIGDSEYSKVHVPTHDLLVGIARDAGWVADIRQPLRTRRSFAGLPLTQELIRFRVES